LADNQPPITTKNIFATSRPLPLLTNQEKHDTFTTQKHETRTRTPFSPDLMAATTGNRLKKARLRRPWYWKLESNVYIGPWELPCPHPGGNACARLLLGDPLSRWLWWCVWWPLVGQNLSRSRAGHSGRYLQICRSRCPALSELPLHSHSANGGPIYRHCHPFFRVRRGLGGHGRWTWEPQPELAPSRVGGGRREVVDRDFFILGLGCIYGRSGKVTVVYICDGGLR
jgi:hypothetical protein